MTLTYIVCDDPLGLSFSGSTQQMRVYIESSYVSDVNKLTKAVFEKIIENNFPKEPYFFYSKDLLKSIRLQINSKQTNVLFVSILPNTDYIYKLKITGVIEDPLYFLCSSRDIVSDLISKMKKKYKNCTNGTFKFKSTILESNNPLDKCNFNSCPTVNEIIFEQNVTKEVKIRKTKEKIPLPVKNTLWSKYFGENINGICHCCKTTPIHLTNFDCGHIISEQSGGSVHLDNLKPICRTCNSSMGTQNMDDYMKRYGFDKLEFFIKK